MNHTEKPYHVLIADDADQECCMLKTAIHQYSKWRLVGEVHSNDALMAYLQGEIPYHNRSQHLLPDLLLMDAILPGGQAPGVLNWVRNHPEMTMQVIVLGGVFMSDYCNHLIQLGAQAWVRKIENPDLLACLINNIATQLH
ncbi:response regulator receiver protein [Pedosphaera parvula Ellin514]|uniref:Response regulator receiver protein n=2 Tax=Pedosphaera TaxID=1032526 RepID=B9XAV9_PEDPL|nr:response regulator receiver protein [Pedosphaera parvula Ellin514]